MLLIAFSLLAYSTLFDFAIQSLKGVFALANGTAPSAHKNVRNPVAMRQPIGARIEHRAESLPLAIFSCRKVSVGLLQSILMPSHPINDGLALSHSNPSP